MSKFRSELTLNLASYKDLSYMVAQGLSGKTEMNANDYFRFSNFAFSYFVGYEVAFQRNKSKNIDSDIAKGLKESLNWWLSFPGVQVFQKNNLANGFSSDFVKYINASIIGLNHTSQISFQNQIKFMQKAGEREVETTQKP